MQILRICVGSDSMRQIEQIGGSGCYPLFVGADNGNRTHDLVITKAILVILLCGEKSLIYKENAVIRGKYGVALP